MEREIASEPAEHAPGRPSGGSRLGELVRHARKLQLSFRSAPVGGRLVALKRLAYRMTASSFDRQAKAVEALLDAVEEAAAAMEVSAQGPDPAAELPDPGPEPPPVAEGAPRSLSTISAIGVSMSMPERVLLYSLVFGLKPRRCLEIGTLHGGSAAVICAAMGDNGRGRLICVDPEPRISPENQERIAARATVVQGSSPEVLVRARREAGGPFDFVLIDGDHSVPGVLRDVDGVLAHVSDPAYLLFHDCHFIDVAEAIAEALRRHPRRLVDCGVLSVAANPLEGDAYRGRPVVWGGMRLLRCRSPQR